MRALADSPVPAQWLLALARVAGQMGPGAVFVLCEECDGDDGRATAAEAQRAITAVTGIPRSNVLCVASTMEVADAAPARAAGPWRTALTAWYGAWAADRAGKMRPALAPMRETVQFWAMLCGGGGGGGGGDGVGSGAGGRNGGGTGGGGGGGVGGENGDSNGDGAGGATAAEEEISQALQHLAASHVPPPSTSSKPSSSAAGIPSAAGVGEKASKLHASAALVSLGSFLRTSIEGLPRLGVIGAPEIAARHMRQDPHLTRRGLLATVYRYSAMEFAAGFVLSWMVPGPLAALAAHFTNRFRICFAVAVGAVQVAFS
jgi:hypothetical protein